MNAVVMVVMMHWMRVYALKVMPRTGFSRAVAFRSTRNVSFWRDQSHDESSPLQQLREELEADHPQRERCLQQMSQVTLSHLGLENMAPLTRQLCMSIVESETFHLAAFLIPKRKQIPIHDHPNMRVYSKLVTGVLRTRSFTRVHSNEKRGRVVVRLHEDTVRTPTADPWFITETEGNYHEFTAEEDCVILDVLCPPYSYPSRPCTFYTMHEDPGVSTATAAQAGDTNSPVIGRSLTSNEGAGPASVAGKEPLWELRPVPEAWAARQHGLPVGAPYRGYVPQPRKMRS